MNIISIIVRSKFLLLKFLLTNKRISSHKNGIFSKIINLKIYIFTEELSLAFKRKVRSFRGNSEEILQNFSSTNISSNCPRIYLISWTVIALFHIQKSGHLEDEFTKFSVTSGHVSKGKGNGNHAWIANCICDVHERDQAIDWTRGRVARSLMVREHQSSLSRAQKCLGESCSRGRGEEEKGCSHTIALIPRCTHVRVWVPARVGDAVARDTTVTRSKLTVAGRRERTRGEILKGEPGGLLRICTNTCMPLTRR